MDSALVQLDRYEFVHDSTDQIDSYTQTASKRLQYFKNIQIVAPTIYTPDFFDEDYTEVRADVFEFQRTVSLAQNTNPGHVPLAWARGRRSIAAHDTVRYDGYFEPYMAQVVDVTADEAVLLGRTYRLWSPDSTKSYGWFPLRLPLSGGSKTIFSFSYLADTTTARSAPTRFSIGDLRIESNRTVCTTGRPAWLRLWAPAKQPLTLDIFDLTGRRVTSLSSPAAAREGWREIAWNGLDRGRMPVPAGVYFGRVHQGSAAARVSLVVVR